MSAARPIISVFGTDGSKTGSAPLPAVFMAPLRSDIVQFVHTNMAKNHRQVYAVNTEAGHQTSAVSWGTGRAVSRIPRVGGGGTQRSGQAAFGNMCRSGRMFAPTKTWRRWHRKVNVTQKRFAVSSALAASAVAALVMARGHAVENVPEVPLVIGGNFEKIATSKQAKALLAAVGANDDATRASDSKQIRSGKGKMRNRRYTMRRGPLIVYASEEKKIELGFRNFPGVELCCVSRLNLLQLAPGGHMGRFVIYSEGAITALDAMYGGADGKRIPNSEMTNADLARIINSDEVQSAVNPAKSENVRYLKKKNATKSKKALATLSPYAAAARASETKAQEDRKGKKTVKKSAKKSAKAGRVAFYEKISKQGPVCENGFNA
jgi:large subunit ribosomal protein L4e